MSLKQEIRRLLRREEFVSGEILGQRLGVSRAAISKAIAAMQREGYEIQAVPRRGYRLLSGPQGLSQTEVRQLLQGHPWADRVTVLDTVDSTNTRVKALAAEGAPHGTVVIADCQTGGKGRLGRQFLSESGVGVYFSALLRPKATPEQLMDLTARAAVAVRQAIYESCGVSAGIKWVNDLVCSNRKVCGILTELSMEAESGQIAYAVVGIGINCNQTPEDFPPELRSIAGSLRSETGGLIDRNRLAAALVKTVSQMDAVPWQEQYRQHCLTLGKEVQILSGAEARLAKAVDIDGKAGLIVEYPDGTRSTIQAGEVSVRGLYGYV